MKKNYTEEDMLKVIQEVEAEFSQALAKAEAEVEQEDSTEESTEENTENFEQEVEELYSSMEKSEAETHFKALSKVLNVSEMTKSEENEENEETKLIKSEFETVKASNEELKKSNEELKKNLEQAISIITKTVKPATAPVRKAITSEMEFIKKSEMENETPEKDVTKLSKSEIKTTLSEKIRAGKLEKKDRDAVVNYYEGKTNIDSIKHLL